MKHIIRILLAVALLFAVPIGMNAQTPKGKIGKAAMTKGKTTKGKGTTTSKKKVIDQRPFATVKPLAEKGDAKAQYRLGECYYYGDGISRDFKQAEYWYRKAADNGYARAQVRLGGCYHEGRGVAKDDKQSVYWYRKAAEQGYVYGQSMLGLAYHFGVGVTEDWQQAAYWLQKAAAQGDSEAKKLLDLQKAISSITLDSKTLKSLSTSSAPASSSSSEQVHDVVEQMPAFPGGQSALFQYLSQNIKYPEICEKKGIQGRVVCSLVVDIDGSITDVQVQHSVDPYLDAEAVRVIKSMPKWIPGKQEGKPVRVRYTVPISFRLQ